MSKTEYDLKAIIYSTYDTPHKLYNISGNQTIWQPRLPPNLVQADSNTQLLSNRSVMFQWFDKCTFVLQVARIDIVSLNLQSCIVTW